MSAAATADARRAAHRRARRRRGPAEAAATGEPPPSPHAEVPPADPAAVAALAARLGHDFRDPSLLERALTHRSAAAARRQLDSNERLEFLGDRVLSLCVAERLVERFPEEREGELGRRHAVLVAAETCARVGEALGVAEALRVPPGEDRAGLRARLNVLADATEAVIGALYLDGGLAPARRLVREAWEPRMEADAARPPSSAKNRLQEHTLKRGLGLPAYRLVSSGGPAHAPLFVVEATAMGRAAEGAGDTKQAAEQAAAEAWLAALPTPEDGSDALA